jgi:multimeric flavodoxin WrbA
MKILILQGAYRQGGNTAHVTQLIAAHLKRIASEKAVPLELETIDLGHKEIGMCRGCRACFDRGEDKCPLKDDFLSTKTAVQAADGVIIASPIYVDDINGITKNWIDRMAHVCHRPEFAGKAAYLVTTVGSSPSSHSLRTLFLAFTTWGFYISGQDGFVTGAKMDAEELNAKFSKRTERIARKLFSDIAEGKTLRPSFVSLMMFKIYQQVWKDDKDTVDSRYWHDKGWVDPRANYYFPPRTNPVIIFLARLTGSILVRFVA